MPVILLRMLHCYGKNNSVHSEAHHKASKIVVHCHLEVRWTWQYLWPEHVSEMGAVILPLHIKTYFCVTAPHSHSIPVPALPLFWLPLTIPLPLTQLGVWEWSGAHPTPFPLCSCSFKSKVNGIKPLLFCVCLSLINFTTVVFSHTMCYLFVILFNFNKFHYCCLQSDNLLFVCYFVYLLNILFMPMCCRWAAAVLHLLSRCNSVNLSLTVSDHTQWSVTDHLV